MSQKVAELPSQIQRTQSSWSETALHRYLDKLFVAAGAVGAFCIALIGALMIVQSAGRKLGINTGATIDVVAWLCAAAAFLTMAHAFKHGDFVRVSLVLEKLPARWCARLEVMSLVLATVAIGYLAYWACVFTYESWAMKELAQGLWALPLWIPQMSFVVGSLLFWLAVVDELALVLSGNEPTYARLVRERHEAGDFSSDL